MALGNAVDILQRMGSKRAEIALHGESIYDLMCNVRAKGVECAFLSAVGPGIVLLTSKTAAELEQIASEVEVTMVCAGRVDNLGLQVETTEYVP